MEKTSLVNCSPVALRQQLDEAHLESAEKPDLNFATENLDVSNQHGGGEGKAVAAHTWDLHQKIATVEQEVARLETVLGRSPSSDDMALALGISRNDYLQLLMEMYPLPLISREHHESGLHEIEKDGLGLASLGQEALKPLVKAIDTLPDIERMVITLFYHEELSAREVSAVLDLTESSIIQMHSQAMIKLRGCLRQIYCLHAP